MERQNTWFNRNNDVKWFKLNFEKIINYINKQINNY